MTERFLFFQRHPIRIAREIPKDHQTAHARDEVYGVIVQIFFLNFPRE